VALLVLWNLGLVARFRERKYPDSAPLERLAEDQAKALHRSVRDGLGAVAGAKGRALAYDLFSGEYFYRGFNKSGTILLRDADERYLLRGWHTGSRRTARQSYRRALYPEACVAVPLEAPFDLRVGIFARAPDGLDDQTLTLYVNQNLVSSVPLGMEWKETSFLVPEGHLARGENELCLRFTGSAAEEDGALVAALVERIQLP
jgi:hypothetical protein